MGKIKEHTPDLITLLSARRGDGRPLYSYRYISALFGMSEAALRQFASYYRIDRFNWRRHVPGAGERLGHNRGGCRAGDKTARQV